MAAVKGALEYFLIFLWQACLRFACYVRRFLEYFYLDGRPENPQDSEDETIRHPD